MKDAVPRELTKTGNKTYVNQDKVIFFVVISTKVQFLRRLRCCANLGAETLSHFTKCIKIEKLTFGVLALMKAIPLILYQYLVIFRFTEL